MPSGVYKRKPFTQEHKDKLSKRIISQETREKLRKAQTGKKLSQETINKIVAKNTGKKRTEETKKKIGMVHIGSKYWLGKKHKPETKIKIGKAQMGKLNHNWKGGTSRLPYSVDWVKTLKRSIRERDHYQCQICGINQEEVTHHVHHIDYNKKNCNTDNLITLCKSCHTKTNFNRDYWLNYFKNNENIRFSL